jgi:hypothetical protein
MVELLDFVVRERTILIAAIPLDTALQVRVAYLSQVPSAIAFPVVEAATGVLVVAGVGELAGEGLEGLQVEAEEHVLLQVGQFVAVNSEAKVRAVALRLALRGLVDEWMVAVLVGVVRVLAGLLGKEGTCSSQVQNICVG